jgi:GTPase
MHQPDLSRHHKSENRRTLYLADSPLDKPKDHAILVGVSLPNISAWEAEDSLDELSRLADTANLTVLDRVVQNRRSVDSAHYLGKGKIGEIKSLARDLGAHMIIFDNDLSPSQMRNIEKMTDMRILDRSALILDIFSRHARTHTAQLQVELAQLNYLMPRLTGQWTHLSRQAGGGAIRGMGSAGVRGPGETQLETDRRQLRRRATGLSKKLARISRQMATSRKRRDDTFKVALVGYTNAGKSTLMRHLSDADILVRDQLFATLDSTTRAVQLDGRQPILLTDTVGFIKRLPHHLFASFRATLEEAIEADLLLHVVDMSHPHYESQVETVKNVLLNLGLESKSTVTVYNKIDNLDPGEGGGLLRSFSGLADTVAISAQTGVGVDILKEKIRYYRDANDIVVSLRVPQSEGRLLAQLRHQGEILQENFDGDAVNLRLRLDSAVADQLRVERFALAETL